MGGVGDAALYTEEALRADLDEAIPTVLSDAAHSAHAAVSFMAHTIRFQPLKRLHQSTMPS